MIASIQRSLVLGCAAFALAGAASAAQIPGSSLNLVQGSITSPTSGITFTDSMLVPGGAFNNAWDFNLLAPVSQFSASLNWNPFALTGVTGQLFRTDADGVPQGAAVASFVLGNNALSLDWTSVVAGYYSIVVKGSNDSSDGVGISGQYSSKNVVPAPAAAGLLGLGMLAMALVRGRRSV